ncbi:MAG: hypothetical protein IKK57_04160 [Clostridia bacterium]|nr:hypothetical protein [Clostridia bacterium]
MKKFASIMGIVLSVVLIALGVLNMLEGFTYLNSSGAIRHAFFGGNTADNTSFGGDFYTYSYRATRYAANNVHALGEYVETVVEGASGLGLILLGLAGLALSLYGLGAAAESKMQRRLLARIANELNSSSCKEQELLQQIADKKLQVTVPACQPEE